MARKDLGKIELQWTCPNCGGINPGPDKLCNQCGAAQPENVEFEQAERQQIISEREKEVIMLLIKGLSYNEISEKLFISYKTVDKHISNIYEKTNVNNRFNLINLIQGTKKI